MEHCIEHPGDGSKEIGQCKLDLLRVSLQYCLLVREKEGGGVS